MKRLYYFSVALLLLASCSDDVTYTDPIEARWYFESAETPVFFKFDITKEASIYTPSNVHVRYYTLNGSDAQIKIFEDAAVTLQGFDTDSTINALDIVTPDFHIKASNLVVKDTTIQPSSGGNYLLRWVKVKEMRFTIPGSGSETVLKKQYIKRMAKD